MKRSSLVIEGLLKMPNALFILSTHLYEIGDAPGSPQYPVQLFETSAENGQLHFQLSPQRRDQQRPLRLPYPEKGRRGGYADKLG